jgi:hypothetical protein
MQRNIQTPELLVEEVRPTGDGRFHVATQISRDGAVLVSSEPSDGKRFLWLRVEIPQNDEFVPVLVEVIYENRLGQFYYRGIRVKHVFEAHRKALFSYLDRLAVQTSTLREVSHG